MLEERQKTKCRAKKNDENTDENADASDTTQKDIQAIAYKNSIKCNLPKYGECRKHIEKCVRYHQLHLVPAKQPK